MLQDVVGALCAATPWSGSVREGAFLAGLMVGSWVGRFDVLPGNLAQGEVAERVVEVWAAFRFVLRHPHVDPVGSLTCLSVEPADAARFENNANA